ncbi:MAG: acyltransferase, partial [Caulobacteraceae bacterium]|nr:acyltransferase [Caulobacter sp.]
LERGRFSLLGFYAARVRRIVPAMTVLVAATFAVGIALLDPLKLESLARDALASLLFVSNIRYAHAAGYFATPAEDNWLIHTWSLSVEWQFYMLYPLALMALAALGARRRAIALVALVAAAASLALMVRDWTAGGGLLDQGFFLLPSRVWEFLAGGLVALVGARLAVPARAGIALHAAGLALIVAGVALVDRSSAWPSPLTAICVAGAALVLLARRETAWWARLAPVHALGKWSYSIYLWHWPIVALLAFYGLTGRGPAVAGIAASVLCGFASYALVETRLTEALWRHVRVGRPAAAAAFAAVAGLTLFAAESNGLERLKYARRPDILAALADARAASADWTFPKSCDRFQWDATTNDQRCAFGDPAAHDTLVIGDSFAEQLTPRFAHRLARSGVTFLTQGGCVPIPGVERPTPGMNCGRFVERAYAYAAASPFKRVVVTAFWPGYGADNLCVGDGGACTALDKPAFEAGLRAGFARMAARWRALREAGKTVVAIDVPPYGGGDPTALAANAVAGAPVTA